MLRSSRLAVLLLLASCSPAQGDPQIEVDSPWARPTLGTGQMSAAYLTIRNSGNGGDRLLGASSEVAAKITLHSSSSEGGIARMRPIEGGLTIAAGSTVKLEPGGSHMMLERVNRPLSAGDRIILTLDFERSGRKLVQAEVGNGPAAHEGH